ncbi:CGG triplet repeat-binding protein 1-like [Alligator mississippiensis]|uniref:CGG triplet repeat-binding protein 1-like n=1 Tax=Alligator mississippiensis TaxID=8496 RepID=UPI0007116455|nr:CGG triplet repeat-binding protein 1-like [Alligator mississippiensis]
MNSKKSSKMAKYISAPDHARQYPEGTLHTDGDKFSSTSCNVILDGSRKNSINWHLVSEAFKKGKAAGNAEGHSKKQESVSSLLKRTTESSLERQEVAFSFMKAFTAANIPLEKLDHLNLRDYMNQNVPTAGSFPCTKKLPQDQWWAK